MKHAPADTGVTSAAAPDISAARGLRFAGPEEAAFQADYYDKTASATRLAAIGGFVMWLAFGLLDYWLLPETRATALLLRFGMCAPFYLLMIVMSYLVEPRRYLQYYVASAMFLCGFTIVLMIALSEPSEPAHSVYFAGIILVYIGGYVF
jgi:hypothetical protein